MTPARPTLRPFAPEDLPALQRIRAAAFAPIFRSFREIVGPEIAPLAFAQADLEQARHLAEICADAERHHPHVAELDGGIVGFVSFTVNAGTRIGEIGLNAVHPAHAGRGIGTLMYEHVVERMRALGMVLATVGTGGDPSHAPARRAYEKAGFGPGIPSVFLYKRL